MFFALSTNTIVSSMLILGGSATVNDLTGMPTLAACFLIPVSVGAYTVVGGMRSTLLADYIHTAVLVAIICKSFCRRYRHVSTRLTDPVTSLQSLSPSPCMRRATRLALLMRCTHCLSLPAPKLQWRATRRALTSRCEARTGSFLASSSEFFIRVFFGKCSCLQC